MAILEDAFKGGNIATGLAFGVGAAFLAPLAVSVLRPVSKAVLKAGLIAYDQGRVAVAEMNEMTSDLVAEARTEMAEATNENGGSSETGARRARKSEAAEKSPGS
ncbi:MAG: DUF5132 domain-containing protein [Mesorhizobium sp.]|uniref:DUF5132 domain-containing protein n=1 Tax=Mesorhizobium sp. TaxID=1871066 RepID=UPI000FEAAED1|nr:DUF5132 domain-containing protein [Mesorhizobium sp.]RWC36193.1 MAG: DUF5132 domain-containing protein [Mesorhizobium sp.]